MKPLLIAALAASFSLWSVGAEAQGKCTAIVPASVEVSEGGFTLADLLAPESCPALRWAASGVRMGSAPLAGSVRVIEGEAVRTHLRKAAVSGTVAPAISVPPRIVVRRAGARASCADIGQQILATLGAGIQVPAAVSRSPASLAAHLDCGAGGRIARDAPLERTRTVWDPALGSWEISARCAHPADCVPFLVRLPAGDPNLAVAGSAQPPAGVSHRQASSVRGDGRTPEWSTEKPLVRPGETVSLLWDQGGIRVVAFAVCLDRGARGNTVRARIRGGSRVVRAIVVGEGELRAIS